MCWNCRIVIWRHESDRNNEQILFGSVKLIPSFNLLLIYMINTVYERNPAIRGGGVNLSMRPNTSLILPKRRVCSICLMKRTEDSYQITHGTLPTKISPMELVGGPPCGLCLEENENAMRYWVLLEFSKLPPKNMFNMAR